MSKAKKKQKKQNKKAAATVTVLDKVKAAYWKAYKDIIIDGKEAHVYFSENNGKTNMPTIDLLPLLTCHGRCRELCGKIEKGKALPPCYAAKYVNRFPALMQKYAENTILAIYKPTQYWDEVNAKMKISRFMRLFGSGDMIINGYFENLCKALDNNPHCNIQGFTKCFEIVNRYIDKYGSLPKNLHLLFSGWYDYMPINPHNLPESRVYDEELPMGWLGCCGNCMACCCIGTGCWKAENGEIVGLKKH